MLIHVFAAGVEFVGWVEPEQLKDDQKDTMLVVDKACRVIYDQNNKMVLANMKGKKPESDGKAHLDRRGLAYIILDERGSVHDNWQRSLGSSLIVVRRKLQ
jgi:uncharacterized protein YcfJ